MGSIFDILGPVMVGPSSSHTAGAVRIGQIARQLFGVQPQKATVYLHGSFAATGKGHGTDKALIAGLLHDCAKDYPADMKRRFCKEYHIPVDDIMKKQIDLTHPFLGAEVAKREYGVEDEEILEAIRWHTTGKPDMTVLDKIIFIADYIEPNRKKFDGLETARKLTYEDLDKAMKYILESTIEYVKERNRNLHPYSIKALEYYSKKA